MRDPDSPPLPLAPGALVAPAVAVARFLERAALAAPRREEVMLDAALGRILAAPIRALEALPAHARSTMDGFAVASAAGARPRRITGEIFIGQPPPCGIAFGEALRIPTGGVLPAGADAVVPFEDVEEADGIIRLREAPPARACVIEAGADVASGELLLAPGRRLGAAEIGLLAALGTTLVPVYVRPRFAIVSTGDELVDPGATPAVGQLRDANRYAIAAGLRAMGAEAFHLPRVADDFAALRSALAGALAACDGVVVSGGSSVGAGDLVPRVAAGLGAPGVLVHGLRAKPGKPTLLAAFGGKPLIGLPGNPVSALLVLEAVVRPIVAASLGARDDGPATLAAEAAAPFEGRDGWTYFIPSTLERRGGALLATPLRLRSGLASLLARSSGYVVLGPNSARVERGAPVTVVGYAGGGVPLRGAA
jgi:molybdenum cofactor synthesis domain-containing protein